MTEAFDDVEVLWRAMLEAADIKVFETLDHGMSGITFLSYAEQREAEAKG